MKFRQNKNLVAIATAVVVFNFTSCTYEDGPKISLKSKTGRLVGEWEVTKLAGDKVGSDVEYEMEFEKDGDFLFSLSYSYYGYTYDYTSKGSWEWGNDKESIELDLDGDPYEFDIKRLTNKELWMEDEEGDEWELEKI